MKQRPFARHGIEHGRHATSGAMSGPFVSLARMRKPVLPDAAWDPLEARVVRRPTLPPDPRGRYVLLWLLAQRRLVDNPAFALAVRRADAAKLPLVVYEGLRPDYPGANDRLHTFILEGVRETAERCRKLGIRYVLYVPPRRRGMVKALFRLAREASEIVTDHHPSFIYPRQTEALIQRSGRAVTTVDGCGVVPLKAIEGKQFAARTIRPRLHRLLPTWLPWEASADGPSRKAPRLALDADWETDPFTPVDELVARCDIDHAVKPSPLYRGGRTEALARVESFVRERLDGYASGRNVRAVRGTSELSPYLHFGMVSAGEVARRILRSGADDEDLEAFCEQLVVRRELCFNFSQYARDEKSLDELPAWAKTTIRSHAKDRRQLIDPASLEQARSGDEVWDAAQTELVHGGRIHNYLRMLWGKRTLEWFPSADAAHAWLIAQHDRYALDGRDPCTYANILWLFGLHDRAFGPERPIFGKLRYMTSKQAKKKVDFADYQRFVAELAGAQRSRR